MSFFKKQPILILVLSVLLSAAPCVKADLYTFTLSYTPSWGGSGTTTWSFTSQSLALGLQPDSNILSNPVNLQSGVSLLSTPNDSLPIGYSAHFLSLYDASYGTSGGLPNYGGNSMGNGLFDVFDFGWGFQTLHANWTGATPTIDPVLGTATFALGVYTFQGTSVDANGGPWTYPDRSGTLTVVPEPGCLVLSILGIGFLIVSRRKQWLKV